MRTRIFAQGFTVVAIIVGVAAAALKPRQWNEGSEFKSDRTFPSQLMWSPTDLTKKKCFLVVLGCRLLYCPVLSVEKRVNPPPFWTLLHQVYLLFFLLKSSCERMRNRECQTSVNEQADNKMFYTGDITLTRSSHDLATKQSWFQEKKKAKSELRFCQ